MIDSNRDTSAADMAGDVDWDELDEIAVIGIDSEGARRVYTNIDDPKTWLWLARQLALHVDDKMRAGQADLSDGMEVVGHSSY